MPRRLLPRPYVAPGAFLGARLPASGRRPAKPAKVPEPATPSPEASSWERWRLPRAWASSVCSYGGPSARLRAGRPRSQGGLGSDVPGSAGILPASGRRPAKRREERHARAGYSLARGVVMGAMAFPRAWACRPHCSYGGPSARLRAGRPRSQGGPGSDVPGSAGILPASGRRPAKCREERHARAGYSLARGVVMGVMGSPESVGVARLLIRRAFGPLAGGTPALPGGGLGSDVPGSAGSSAARIGPKARKVPRGATPLSRLLPRHARGGDGSDGVSRERGCRSVCSYGGPSARLRAGRPRSQGVALGAMFLGARASCPHRAEGP